MSKANPRKAMAAFLPLEIKVAGYDFTIKPVTLGMYAALERIGSPLITGKDAQDTLELIPSLYLLTHDPREVFRGDMIDEAMRWADTVGIDAVGAIRKAAAKQLLAAFDVIPEDDGEGPKKKRTAGSPRSPVSRRKPSDGPGAKHSGKSLSRPSSCSGVKTESGKTKSSRCSR